MDPIYDEVPTSTAERAEGDTQEEDRDLDIYTSLEHTSEFEVEEKDEVTDFSQYKAPPESEWLHGVLSREDANYLLTTRGKIQSYLVRESPRGRGDYTLSFRTPSGVKHFKIISEFGEVYLGNQRYPSLADLVGFFHANFLCDDLKLLHPFPPQRHMVVAIYPYRNPKTDKELVFEAGDVLEVLSAQDAVWWWVEVRRGRLQGTQGFVPASFVAPYEPKDKDTLESLPYFYGTIPRQEAARLLTGQPDGTFLVRQTASPGDYSLSAVFADRVWNFRIRRISSAHYIFGEFEFLSVEEIVGYYSSEAAICEGHHLIRPLINQSSVPPSTQSPEPQPQSPETQRTSGRPASPAGSPLRGRAPNLSQGQRTPEAPARPTKAAVPEYVKTGYISRKGRRGSKWSPNWVCLSAVKKRLYIFDEAGSTKAKCIIDLTVSSINKLHTSFFGRPNVFQLTQHSVDTSSYYFCTNNIDERDRWFLEISRIISPDAYHFTNDQDNKCIVRRLTVGVRQTKCVPSKIKQLYCLVCINGVPRARTVTKTENKENADPGTFFWGDEFSFDDIPEDFTGASVEVYNKTFSFGIHRGRTTKDILYGTVNLSPAALEGGGLDAWLPICSERDSARLHLKVAFTHEQWLPLASYTPLKEMLLREDLEAAQLLGLVGTEREVLARALLRLHQANGTEEQFLAALCSQEIRATKDPHTIFRGNTLATKAMDQYLKLTAIAFLHECIKKHIDAIVNDKGSCEVDPTKVAKAEQTDKATAERTKRLLGHLQALWNDIYDKRDLIPGELKRVFGAIYHAVLEKWGPTKRQVARTAVGGFIFLRMFCPSIMNPKMFNMLDDHPSEAAERTLKLVAKTLQNLANHTEAESSKETYMQALMDFVQVNKRRMEGYLDDISQLPTHAVAKTPKAAGSLNQRAELATIACSAARHRDKIVKLIAKHPNATGSQLLDVVDNISRMAVQAFDEDSVYANMKPSSP